MKGKVISMLTALALALSMAAASAPAFADKEHRAVPRGVLASQIDYWFVGHLGETNDQGMPLIWKGVGHGAINGEGKWYFTIEPPVINSPFSFYKARWEIWSEGKLILAGESAGKTVFPEGVSPSAAPGIWDGHGVVTEARGRFNKLKGRKTYETGPVFMGDAPPATFYGTGMFTIY